LSAISSDLRQVITDSITLADANRDVREHIAELDLR
jgi:hypothetical protein